MNNSNVERTNKASKTSKCISKKYSAALIFWKFSTQNEETTSETEYATTANMEDTTPATTEPQPMEMDTSISEITTKTIRDLLIPNNNDNILITIRQPVRLTRWVWTSSRKGWVQVRWKIPFVDTDYGRPQCTDGKKFPL